MDIEDGWGGGNLFFLLNLHHEINLQSFLPSARFHLLSSILLGSENEGLEEEEEKK